jgi:peptidoglycan hydrolase CwlO-like protein
MSKKTLTVLMLGLVAVFLLSSAGCVSKKRLRSVEEQNAQQLAQANARIDDLVQKNEALDKGLKDAQAALTGAQAENTKLAADAASLNGQIAALEAQKVELDKALAAGMVTATSYQKKVRSLNGSIAALKKKVTEMESQIAAKDAEIASLQRTEASLKAAAEEQDKKMAALSADKDALTAQLDMTVSGKKQMTLILGVLLALAVLLAIVGFVRKRSAAA